ncbi:hypothetical protein F511_09220 [Dorcoceras hygrometricum]|uniref:Retrotransposon Copia-like N-terminal domain-containing protein n=1 Tax=Dorcoceras hygrometricum TaxID=472368 RepID=A0A2Z7CVX2_9LAMI|nr:hypothetical protein F511_09220 [Dorcoceras hygrometricum]
MSPSDNLSLQITNHKLNSRNFLQWSQSVLLVIRGRGKMGYLTGQTKRPKDGEPDRATWELDNSIVMAWLIHSMEPQLSQNFLFLKTAKAIWDAVTATYSDLGNCYQVFELKTKLRETRRGTLEVTEYFTLINNLWQELDMFYEADWGDPEIVREILEIR